MRRPSPIFLTPLVALLVSLATPLAAFEDPYDKYRYNREEEFDYDEGLRKPWQEGQSEIPPLPKASAMLEVPIDGLGDDFEVLIDPNSLSIGEDRVVRYWLMLRSHLGAVNLHYEGINCNTGQYKAYAYGSPREASGFRAVKEPRWAPLKALRGRGFRPELQQLFCDYGLPLARRDIIKRIRDAASGFGSGRDSGPNAFF